MGEMSLDGLDAHEERVGDLPVRAASGCEARDPFFDGGQLGGRGRTTADPPELVTRLLRPQRRSQPLEGLERTTQRLPREALLPLPSLYTAEDEECPCELERLRQPLVFCERSLDRLGRCGEITARGGDERRRSRAGRDGPRASERAPARLELLSELGR